MTYAPSRPPPPLTCTHYGTRVTRVAQSALLNSIYNDVDRSHSGLLNSMYRLQHRKNR